MKMKLGCVLLGTGGVLCILMDIAGLKMPGLFTSVMAFPYEQTGLMLRKMSLSGAAGNAWAIVIYALISLLPIIYWLVFRRRNGFKIIDCLLPVMSASLFGGLYIIINPGYLPGGMGVEIERAVTGCALHSVWIGYAILRITENLRSGSRRSITGCLKGMLWILAAAFVYGACGGVGEIADAFTDLAAKNTMPGLDLFPTQIFIVLGAINSAIPCIMNIPVIISALSLTAEFEKDAYGEGAVVSAETLARRCRRALSVTVVSSVCFNVLQLLLAPRLHTIDTTVEIPLISILFTLTALLAAGYIRAGNKIKQDNDLFI